MATIYAYGLPVVLLLLISGYYLIKAAIVSRYEHFFNITINLITE